MSNSLGAKCPTCNVELKTWCVPFQRRNGGGMTAVQWKCECIKGHSRNGCEFRRSVITGTTEADAIAKWSDNNNRGSRRWTLRYQPRRDHEPKVYGHCKCGLRIYVKGATSCNNCVGGILEHIRSGLAAPEFTAFR